MPYITAGLSHIRMSECLSSLCLGLLFIRSSFGLSLLGMWVGSVGAYGSAGWECGSVRVWVCVWVYLLSVYLLLGPFSLHLSLGMWVGSVGVVACGCGSVGWECEWVWECGLGVRVWSGSVGVWECGNVWVCGWECGCVSMWVGSVRVRVGSVGVRVGCAGGCGNVGWECGSVGVWGCGSVGVWECGRVRVWVCVWVCGLGVWVWMGWVCGCVGVGVRVGSVGVWECGLSALSV
ncbi:hypothetical protein RhiirC2_808683 [Rhizophagus irregularis]|uniref:Uncharacterized protein n=1 Tax=Rhizophagus irregularis TaxID=588596 RepID=A0A2N1MVD4_9GLOM|nr:hypothetical protein RhiirC2_808683 [Rhizophagus irregularis]